MILSIFPSLLNNGCTLVIAAFIMVRLRWDLAVPYLMLLPALCLFRVFSSGRLLPLRRDLRDVRARASGVLLEAIRLLPLAKLFGQETREFHRYAAEAKPAIRADFRLWRRERTLSQIQWFLESGPPFVLMCAGWLMVIRGSMTLGSAVAFSMYFGMVASPFLAFASILQRLIAGLAPGDRVLQFLRQPQESTRALPRRTSSTRALGVRFSHVTFSYGTAAAVLSDADFEVPAGRLAVLIGASGAGKTTIFRLCSALCECHTGDVFFGDEPLSRLSPRQVRSLVSVAPQEATLFSGTVMENVLYGRPSASAAEVVQALELACAHEFVEDLPDGLDSHLESEHVSLSAGQAHRLTLARAFLKESPILLLDEPFANVDRLTEAQLWRALEALTGKRTILVAGHRLPPRDACDLILEVGDGEVKLFDQRTPEAANR